MTDVKLALRGLRGESFADIARRQLAYGVSATATDAEVLAAFANTVAETASTDHFAATHAAAVSASAGWTDGDVVQVWADENFLGIRTYYERVSGSLVFRNFATDNYPGVAGETGVLYRQYPVGDVRRYGIFPDGTTNWEGTYPARVAAVYANSLLFRVTWPAGIFATSINLTGAGGGGTDYSGSRMHSSGAVFYGILHLIEGITDVDWTGVWTSYDRLGLQEARRCRIEACNLLNDNTKNLGGTDCRGYHILASTDNVIGDLYIENTGATNSSSPATNQNWAALTVQGIDAATTKGYRNSIRRCHIANAQGHGCYLNGVDIRIGELIIDGYGNQAIDFGSSSYLQDTDSEAQSETGAGLWVNRATGRCDKLRIRQSNASAVNDVYALLIDETGRAGTTSRDAPFTFGEVEIEVGGTYNRGVCIGSILSPSVSAVTRFEHLILKVISGKTMAAGYGMLNLNPVSTSADSKFRTAVDRLTIVDGSTATQVKVTGVNGTRCFNDLQIIDWYIGTMASGKLLVVDATAQAGSVVGNIGRIRGFYQGGSQASTYLVSVDSARQFNILNYALDMNSGFNVAHIKYKSTTDCTINGRVYNENGQACVELDGTTRTRLSGRFAGSSSAGQGVLFTGTNVDLMLGPISCDALAHGFKKGTSCVFTRGTAVQCTAVGTFGTAATDVGTGDFPTAQTLGCVGFTV